MSIDLSGRDVVRVGCESRNTQFSRQQCFQHHQPVRIGLGVVHHPVADDRADADGAVVNVEGLRCWLIEPGRLADNVGDGRLVYLAKQLAAVEDLATVFAGDEHFDAERWNHERLDALALFMDDLAHHVHTFMTSFSGVAPLIWIV